MRSTELFQPPVRMLAIDAQTREALQGVVFPGDLGVENAAEAVGLAARFRGAGRPLSAQLFRHASALHCLEDGMDLIALHYQLGHEFLETTEMYTTPPRYSCFTGESSSPAR